MVPEDVDESPRRPSTETRPERTTRSPLVAKDLASLKAGLVELVPELRGRACRLAGDPTTAEDIVQDTIERALKFAAQYERGTNLRAWVYQILFSVFVTRYRRTRREKNALRDARDGSVRVDDAVALRAARGGCVALADHEGQARGASRRRSAPC